MAKAAWCTVSPMSGEKNGTVNVTVPKYEGRVERSTTVTVTNKNGTKPSKAISIKQAGVGIASKMDETKPDVPKTGGTVVINGKSNSQSLSWDLYTKIGEMRLPYNDMVKTVKVNNVAIASGVNIANDPGANAMYDFVVTIEVTPAKVPMDLPVTFELSDGSNQKRTCVFKHLAGASTLAVDVDKLSFTSTTATKPAVITSNDEWTVS